MPGEHGNARSFDAMAWLKTYLPTSTDFADYDLSHVRDFVMMWGVFEAEACATRANQATIKKAVDRLNDKKMLKMEVFVPYKEFFLDRARSYETTENFLKALGRKSAEEDKGNVFHNIRLFVDGSTSDVNNVVYALLLIVYRIRNNTFHGSKGPQNLLSQQEVFLFSNSLLAKIVDLKRAA